MLEGAPRFRDLGGLPTADGRRIRPGALYRSESLTRLTEGDLERLRGLGIRTVFDLRGVHEQRRMPHRWPQGHEVAFVDLGAPSESASLDAFMTAVGADFTVAGARTALTRYYEELPAAYLDRMPVLFERLESAQSLPAVVLCQFGKDRTGFVVSVLLASLGVTEDAIRAEYAAIGALRHPEDRLRATAFFAGMIGCEPDAAAIDVVMASHPEFLDAAFGAIRRDHGSLDAYLAASGSLDAGRRERLRAALLA